MRVCLSFPSLPQWEINTAALIIKTLRMNTMNLQTPLIKAFTSNAWGVKVGNKCANKSNENALTLQNNLHLLVH